MDFEVLYKILNLVILIPWLLMIIFPKRSFTTKLMNMRVFALLMSVVYLILFILFMGKGDGGMDSLASLNLAFDHPGILLLAWVHYLAFDLLVGIWEFFDAKKKGIPHGFLIPCLVLTLMAGPIGFLLYWIVRTVRDRSAD